MLVHIPKVLDADQVARCRSVLDRAAWVEGRASAGFQGAQVKDNLQLPEGAPEARELGDVILLALKRSPLFLSAALPHTVMPPLFNRYDPGMAFGAHVDNAIRQSIDGLRIRTDVAASLFLTGPEDYDGGEITVEDTYGSHTVKLPAGDLVIYPADSLHRVAPVTRGSRVASFFWIQSLVRDRTRRALLFDLDTAIRHLTRDTPGHAALATLTGTYHNLLRQWSDL